MIFSTFFKILITQNAFLFYLGHKGIIHISDSELCKFLEVFIYLLL